MECLQLYHISWKNLLFSQQSLECIEITDLVPLIPDDLDTQQGVGMLRQFIVSFGHHLNNSLIQRKMVARNSCFRATAG